VLDNPRLHRLTGLHDGAGTEGSNPAPSSGESAANSVLQASGDEAFEGRWRRPDARYQGTTARYTQVATTLIADTTSPLDRLSLGVMPPSYIGWQSWSAGRVDRHPVRN